ncbi:MAG TPA: nucleotidyltransferase domain-containing protein [Thermoflexales bacterium]|nr:nucleotidyltransferase domain-containing protein [Thermoflexales bacterium]HQW35155.1 nucleotidyltransferase domain-containing protein [Thermoflexales bacterium]HQZ21363.1 nucleotidyltransferase domain-containing protein [Thermoflexales bacterium]
MRNPLYIAQLLIDHANRAFPGEVAIVAYYGSHARGAATASSDLDLFYIPADGADPDLCRQFVLDGLPYDFWPVRWSFAEHIANASSDRPWVRAASLIAGAEVAYHRADEDLARFVGLQNRVAELMQPDHAPEMIVRALDAWRNVLARLGAAHLLIEIEGRGEALPRPSVGLTATTLACFQVADEVVNCLALASQTHLPQGWAADPSRVAQFRIAPPDVAELLTRVAHAQDARARLAAADALAQAAHKVLLEAQRAIAKPIPAKDAFLGVYAYALEYRNKILKWREANNLIAAQYDAAQLQNELARAMSAYASGVNHGEFNTLRDVMAPYVAAGLPDMNANDLDELARRAIQLEETLRGFMQARGVDIGVLASEEEVLNFLDRRPGMGDG